jgi:hypothetical protein
MTAVSNDNNSNDMPKSRAMHFEWVLPLIFKPRRTLQSVSDQLTSVWLAPLLLLSVAAILMTAAGGPIRQAAAQLSPSMSPDYQYLPPEEIAKMETALQASQGPLFIYGLPILGTLIGVWAGWFLLSSILHLALTLSGSRSSSMLAFNLVAWASIPFVLRAFLQAGYLVVQKTAISGAGLSGFIPTGATGVLAYIQQLLTFMDIYFIWQVALLLVGMHFIPGITPLKSWGAVLVTALLALLLFALPGFLFGSLGNLTIVQPFFF